MAVINLGQLGEPRKSPLAGVSSAISEGLKIGESRRSSQANIAQRKEEEAGRTGRAELSSQTSLATSENTLRSQLAKIEADKAQEGRKWANLMATRIADMPDDVRSQYEQTPGGQGVIKLIHEQIGEEAVVKEGGIYKIVAPNTNEKIANQVNQIKSDLVQKVRQEGPDALDDSERALLDMFNMAGTDVVATAMKVLNGNLVFQKLSLAQDDASKAKAAQMLQQTIQTIAGAGGRTGITPSSQFTNGLGGEDGSPDTFDAGTYLGGQGL